jgi:HSP20 family molecular chaperone IbpA
MAIVEPKSEPNSIENAEKEVKYYYRVTPDIYQDADYDAKKVEVEIALPGVSKENISLKALPEWFAISAKRPEEQLEYSGNFYFEEEVIPEKTTAEYTNGLLKIHATIRDPMDEAKTIQLQ